MGKALLIIVTGFGLIMGGVNYGLQKTSEQNLDIIINSFESKTVLNTAYSGLNLAISQIFNDFNWRNGYNNMVVNGGNFSVSVDDHNNDSDLNKNQVRVNATAYYNNTNEYIKVVLEKPPFSIYALFTDEMPSPIYFITGDTLRGPIHNNDRYYFSGTPVFYGKVTSVEDSYGTWGYTNPQFKGGSEFGVNKIELPTEPDKLSIAANEGGDVYNLSSLQSLWLNFSDDGSYNYSIKQGGYIIVEGTKELSNHNGVILAQNGNIHVQGTVKGRTTICTTKNIYIENDLKYADDPRVVEDSEDMVGLVAQNRVIVRDNTPNNSDCEIHGSIMAMNYSFEVENYNYGSPRGTLTILGGIIQKRRGPVGTFGYYSRTGYEKNYQYDNRFLYDEPPFFPVAEDPKVVYWWE